MSWEHELDVLKTTDPKGDAEVVLECEECTDGIYEGEDYYKIDGKCYCERCMWKHRRIARRRD